MRQPPKVGHALFKDVVHGQRGAKSRDGANATLVDAAEQGADSLLLYYLTRHADGIAAIGRGRLYSGQVVLA